MSNQLGGGYTLSNMQDIAKKAGVSSATVSRVINQSGYVSSATRKKIEAAIQQMDYVPNSQAVSLKTGSSKTLGIVAPNFSDTMMILVRSFTLAAQQEGYTVTFYITDQDKQKELDVLEMLRGKRLDGIFLLIRLNDWSAIEPYTKYGPIVTWQRVDSDHIASVYMDQYHAYTLGLEHLYASGCRSIVNLYSNIQGLNTKSRIKAYEDFCKRYRLPAHSADLFMGLNTSKDGERVAQWWLEQSVKPDAFMTSTDSVAAGLVTQAQRLGCHLPEDFSVIGFDNIEISRLLDISTIDYPVAKQAKNAFALIYHQLTQREVHVEPLAFQLIPRKTTNN